MYWLSSVSNVTQLDVQFSDVIVLWQSEVIVLFVRPSDVTNSEYKLRKFSNSLTFYFKILGWINELTRRVEPMIMEPVLRSKQKQLFSSIPPDLEENTPVFFQSH